MSAPTRSPLAAGPPADDDSRSTGCSDEDPAHRPTGTSARRSRATPGCRRAPRGAGRDRRHRAADSGRPGPRRRRPVRHRRAAPEAQQIVSGRCSALRATGAEVVVDRRQPRQRADARRATGRCSGRRRSRCVGRVRAAGRRRRASTSTARSDRRAGAACRCCRSCPSGTRCARAELLEPTAGRATPAPTTSAGRGIIAALTAGFDRRRGERGARPPHRDRRRASAAASGGAQTIFEYHVPAAVFPADAHYVALGPPAPAPDRAGPVPGALLRSRRSRSTSARRTTRRSVLRGRGRARHAGRGHRRADHPAAAAADRARHARRAGRGSEVDPATTCSGSW